jgi:hypothetical protein
MFICPKCLRSDVKEASTHDIGFWALVPSAKEVKIIPTCGACSYYGFVCAVTEYGTELACAGKDLSRPIPLLHKKALDVVLLYDFRLRKELECVTGA